MENSRRMAGDAIPASTITSLGALSDATAGDVSLADSRTPLVRAGSSVYTASSIKDGDDSGSSSNKAREDVSTPDTDVSHGKPIDDTPAEPVIQAGKGKRRRRLLFRQPIATVTSTLARAKTPRTNDSPPSVYTPGSGGETPKDALFKAPSDATDHELGYNDGKGTEGILRRVYDTWSLTSLGVANIGPISGAFFGVHTAKEYGGYSMLAIGWPLSGLFMCLFTAVLAEMSSSYPVAGAMYTWTFRLCRLSPTLRPLARFLSWLCGSFLLCGHILAQMLLEWQMATIFQGLIVIYAPGYHPATWKTVLFAWAGLVISAIVASCNVGRSPILWKGFSILCFSTVVILAVSLLVSTSHRNSTATIFTSYANGTGFTSKGYVYLLGWVLTSIATGQDVGSHMAEETKFPTKTVPLAIFWSTAISYISGWVVMLSIMAVSPETRSLDTPVKSYSAPAQMLTEVLPRPVAFVLVLLLVFLMQFQDIAQLLASSRFVWALARDDAVPFSPHLRRLSADTRIPVRAIWVICIFVAPALLLVIGSRKIVTSLILSGCGASLVIAYLIPVLCYLTCARDALDVDGRNEWTLRRWSRWVAVVGTAYICLIIVLMCCPNTGPVTATSFSYAGPIIVVVVLLSTLTWVLFGNSHYAGPIKSITVYTIGREVELPKTTYAISTHNRATPGSGQPQTPIEGNGLTTTEFEIGKTANLYSESIASCDVARRSRAAPDGPAHRTRPRPTGTGLSAATGATDSAFTDAQMTDSTSDGSYTDSSGDSDTDDESARVAQPIRPQAGPSVLEPAPLDASSQQQQPAPAPQRPPPIHLPSLRRAV